MTNTLAITENTPIVFSITPESLIEIKAEQDDLISKVPENIEELDIELYKSAKRKVAKLRVATEKERKELKSAALSYGRLVDSTAADAQKPVLEIEGVYEKLITEYDEHFAALEVEAAQKEEARISAIKERITTMKAFTDEAYDMSVKGLKVLANDFNEFANNGFDYQEFNDEAENVIADVQLKLLMMLNGQKKIEEENDNQEAQRKIDEEKRIALDAQIAAFEAKQKAMQDEIDAKLAAMQKQKDEALRIENERVQKEHEERAQAEFKKQQEELDKQRAIDEEKRKEAEEKEKLRLEQVRIENEARKLAQEKEDRVRNAAPELMNALENLLIDIKKLAVKYEFINPNSVEVSESAIKLAKGE